MAVPVVGEATLDLEPLAGEALSNRPGFQPRSSATESCWDLVSGIAPNYVAGNPHRRSCRDWPGCHRVAWAPIGMPPTTLPGAPFGKLFKIASSARLCRASGAQLLKKLSNRDVADAVAASDELATSETA
jgi:hypothetical protein